MPYITNDTKSILIGAKEFNAKTNKYSGYVVVRTLTISSKKPLLMVVSIAFNFFFSIRKRFKHKIMLFAGFIQNISKIWANRVD